MTPGQALASSCLRKEARDVVLAFGQEFFGWPIDVGDELYDAAEALADRVIKLAIASLPEAGA